MEYLRLQTRIKFYSFKTITDKDGYIQFTIPPGAFEMESLNNVTKRIIIDEAN